MRPVVIRAEQKCRRRVLGHGNCAGPETGINYNCEIGPGTHAINRIACAIVAGIEASLDQSRHFAGSYIHRLVKGADGYRIALQRVDMVNGEGMYEYVLQAWV